MNPLRTVLSSSRSKSDTLRNATVRMLVDVTPAELQLSNHRIAPKPHFHITSPLGWLNDPCAPCYDPNSGLYHLFYQCNPNGVEWGDMSWGHATSEDMVTWKFGPQHTKLEPDKKYDNEGVFTGCMAPLAKDGTMTIFYSSICKLPFHWTSPAPRGSAGLAMATSTDEGKTWIKSSLNPILKEEPEGFEATGFRDPYLAEWGTMDKIRGKKSLYGLISGGIKGSGPTTFLYAVEPTNLTRWDFLGSLVDIPERFSPSEKWNGNYGMNWECVNFMTLFDGEESREVLILGSEGDVQREHLLHPKSSNLPPNIPPRAIRGQQWMTGDLRKTKSGVQMQYHHGGILDHGVYYAANSFHDTKTNRRIVYGWIPEDDCTAQFANNKGWNGCQALPREIWLKKTTNIVKALHSRLEDITSSELIKQENGTFTEYTLGVKPIDELKKLRDSALKTYQLKSFTLPAADTHASKPAQSKQASGYTRSITKTTSPTWELSSIISLPNSSKSLHRIRRVGFHIRASQGDRNNKAVRTSISFLPNEEKIQVNRSHSIPSPLSAVETEDDNVLNEFNTCTEEGPFTLFTRRQSSPSNLSNEGSSNSSSTDSTRASSRTGTGTGTGTTSPLPQHQYHHEHEQEQATLTDEVEPLNLRIISDGDVLEIFANDRFALATMVYTGDPELYGTIEAFVEHETTAPSPPSSLSNGTAEDKDEDVDIANHDSKGVVAFSSVKVWDGLGGGLRFVGYDKDTVPEEVIERRNSKI